MEIITMNSFDIYLVNTSNNILLLSRISSVIAKEYSMAASLISGSSIFNSSIHKFSAKHYCLNLHFHGYLGIGAVIPRSYFSQPVLKSTQSIFLHHYLSYHACIVHKRFYGSDFSRPFIHILKQVLMNDKQ